jgi:hypothetical protein
LGVSAIANRGVNAHPLSRDRSSTTSMASMLPSFAQLEREVTGERICTRNVAALSTGCRVVARPGRPRCASAPAHGSPASMQPTSRPVTVDHMVGPLPDVATPATATAIRQGPGQDRPTDEFQAAHAARGGRNGPPPSYGNSRVPARVPQQTPGGIFRPKPGCLIGPDPHGLVLSDMLAT